MQVVCTTLLIWMSSVSVASSATRRVVLLFDERPELPGLARLDAEFVRTLVANSAEPIEFYREAMDLSRFGSDAHKVRLRDYLRQKYADKQIDVTVAILGPALEFLLNSAEPVFPGAATVFIGIEISHLSGQPLTIRRQRRSRYSGICADAGTRSPPPSDDGEYCGGRWPFGV